MTLQTRLQFGQCAFFVHSVSIGISTVQTHASMKEGLDPTSATDEFHTEKCDITVKIKLKRKKMETVKGQCYNSNLT